MRRLAFAGLTVCCIGVAGCSGSPPITQQHDGTVFVTINPTSVPDYRFPASGTTYAIPQRLDRPLHLPRIQPGQPCPTTHGHKVDFRAFGGFSLGTAGPVHPIIAAPLIPLRHGVAVADRADNWYSVKTLWYALKKYQGPLLIRGARLDGPGSVTFGGAHTLGFLADGGTAAGKRGSVGMRSWPGGTWVREPGCYGFQIGGSGFSDVLVLSIRGPVPGEPHSS